MCAEHTLRFFFNDTATTEIYTLSLHDALPIWKVAVRRLIAETSHSFPNSALAALLLQEFLPALRQYLLDRKSTRLNSSHANISYAVFCLKKKKTSPGPSAL